MALPAFVSFPPASLRAEILPEEWEACIDAWILLAQGHLLLPANIFAVKSAKNQSLINFLISYMKESSHDESMVSKTERVRSLRKECFLLVHRLLTEVDPPPPPLLEWAFLGDLSTVYARSPRLRELINSIWARHSLEGRPDLQNHKKVLTGLLENMSAKGMLETEDYLRRTGALLKASHHYGQFLMVGSDVLDSLAMAWTRASGGLRKKVVTITYLSLLSLLEGEKPNSSLLLDHLYSLKAPAEKLHPTGTPDMSLLSELASNTPFIRKIQDRMIGSDNSRAKPLITYLEGLRNADGTKPKRTIRRRSNKGKNKQKDEYGHGALGGVHVHKMSLITQIQDLFPDLGSGFVVKLLDEYNNNTEQVTAHLLDDSLPAHLKGADRTENIHIPNNQDQDHSLAPDLAPHPTPPLLPSRKNIFDNDPFDNLAISPSNLHIGRKNPHLTASDLLADRSTAPNKAAILSALAAFDSDDDERDDTYDAEDVGGTVDTAIPGTSDDVDANLRPYHNNSDSASDKNEEALFAAYKMSPEVFHRDANTRRGKARAALKSETGMTDEAIEGWGIMVGRDPRRLRRLEVKFSTAGGGGQRELAATAYREGMTESGTEESDGGGGGGRGRGGVRGRGRGQQRGRGGMGRGDVAGPADDKGTQVARQRKDAQKGSRANHNRRDQRARKMARGGMGMGMAG